MTKYKDKTLRDNNRTPLDFKRAEINSVLPEYFTGEYPNLISLFEKYYEWMDSDNNPSDRINKLYSSRDASQVPANLLPELEDELLLGDAYFGGFLNKREAIKFSNLLYRSKGTKYSIEQFFRAFFGTDPQVIYPKEDIFLVGPKIDYDLDSSNSAGEQVKTAASVIGPESRKFLTDDKLYQILSILIRTDIPVQEWIDVYKLFVHPAGIYVGAALLIEAVNTNTIVFEQEDVGRPPETLISLTSISGAIEDTQPPISITLLQPGDSATPTHRQSLDTQFSFVGDQTVESTSDYDLRDLLSPNSVSFDDSAAALFSEDSDGIIRFGTIRFDNHSFDTQYDSA